MTGIMAAFVGMGGGFTISINTTTFSNGGTPVWYFNGWNGVAGVLAGRTYIPLATGGSLASGPTTFNGATINGVYSSSVIGTNTATAYTIVLDGNRSLGFVSGLIINGTTVPQISSGRYYDSSNNQTALFFDVTSAATLITLSSTVSIY